MDKRRAKEIAVSSVMADVTYNGMPIYIESVNGSKSTANIHYLNKTGKSFEVSLGDLSES